jgi:AcrR family transcriptional regulator
MKKKKLSAITTSVLAAEAGVSTATLYRWWPTKEAIALDAFLEKIENQLPLNANIGSPLERMRDHARRSVRFLSGDTGRVCTRVIMAMQESKVLRRTFLERLYLRRRQNIFSLIDEAISAGELPAEVDGDLLFDVIYGPLYYRVLMGHQVLTEEFALQVFDAAVTGLANAKPVRQSP